MEVTSLLVFQLKAPPHWPSKLEMERNLGFFLRYVCMVTGLFRSWQWFWGNRDLRGHHTPILVALPCQPWWEPSWLCFLQGGQRSRLPGLLPLSMWALICCPVAGRCHQNWANLRTFHKEGHCPCHLPWLGSCYSDELPWSLLVVEPRDWTSDQPWQA